MEYAYPFETGLYFRFNRQKTPMAAFQALLDIEMQKSHTTQKNFVKPVSKGYAFYGNNLDILDILKEAH